MPWWMHLLNGIRYGIPFCCTVQFIMDYEAGISAYLVRGLAKNAKGGYVPCYSHTKYHPLRLFAGTDSGSLNGEPSLMRKEDYAGLAESAKD